MINPLGASVRSGTRHASRGLGVRSVGGAFACEGCRRIGFAVKTKRARHRTAASKLAEVACRACRRGARLLRAVGAGRADRRSGCFSWAVGPSGARRRSGCLGRAVLAGSAGCRGRCFGGAVFPRGAGSACRASDAAVLPRRAGLPGAGPCPAEFAGGAGQRRDGASCTDLAWRAFTALSREDGPIACGESAPWAWDGVGLVGRAVVPWVAGSVDGVDVGILTPEIDCTCVQ